MYSTKTPTISPVVEVSNATGFKTVRTPQVKANPKDKGRLRLKDLKNAVLSCYKLVTKELKKYIQQLGYFLDLRLTAAWEAVQFEIRPELDALIAIKEALTPSPRHPFQVGDMVELISNSTHFSTESMDGIHKIVGIKEDLIQVAYFSSWIHFSQLQLILDF